jgi:hypothetical protein
VSDETATVRITQRDIYNKLIELEAIQIEIVADIKNLKDLPSRVNNLERALARLEWVEKLALTGLGAGLSGFIAALWVVIG